MIRRSSFLRTTAASLAALTFSAFVSITAHAQGAAAPATVDSLLKAAKTEGEFVFYSAATENVAKRIAEAFTTKYGVRAKYLRLGSAPLAQRYANEAAAGVPAADAVLIAGGAVAFTRDGVAKGWLDPIETANIPEITSGEFPKAFLRYGGAIVQIAPWLVQYNTELVKPADVPKKWEDVLNPRFKGRLVMADPKAADSFLDVWALLLDTYGEQFFVKLREQNIRWYEDGVPALQALGAGEGDLSFPGVRFLAQGLIDKGAPVETSMVLPTSGTEMYLALTAATKAKSPNAARLFANWLMSPEGSKVMNADPGSYSVFAVGDLPKGYTSPKPETPARRAEIRKLFGLQ